MQGHNLQLTALCLVFIVAQCLVHLMKPVLHCRVCDISLFSITIKVESVFPNKTGAVLMSYPLVYHWLRTAGINLRVVKTSQSSIKLCVNLSRSFSWVCLFLFLTACENTTWGLNCNQSCACNNQTEAFAYQPRSDQPCDVFTGQCQCSKYWGGRLCQDYLIGEAPCSGSF